MRVPFLASYPGRIPEGRTIRSFASMLDLFPTIASVAAAPLPRNPMDGVNIWPVLAGESEAVERPPFLYLDGYNLQCARLGRWKLHMSRYNGPAFAPPPDGGRVNLPLLLPELYDMETGAEECYNTASQNPVIVSDILARVQEILPTLPAAVQSAWSDTTSRPAAYVNAGEWPSPKR
jgi:uncharacterized sulfatase